MFKEKKRKNKENKGFIDIYGTHAVMAALKNIKRKHRLLTISTANKEFLTTEIKNKVPKIKILNSKEIRKIYGNSNSHQGIILNTTVLEQIGIDEIFKKTKKNIIEIIVMLDQVSDPNNIGSIMRSCLMFNCMTVIVAKDNSPEITPSLAKAASGAVEKINYIKVTNLSRTIREFKKNNFWVCGLENNINNIKKEFKIPKKCLLILGAEGKGMRSLTKKECDKIISIPMLANQNYGVESLNVSNACSIALYEHFKNYC